MGLQGACKENFYSRGEILRDALCYLFFQLLEWPLVRRVNYLFYFKHCFKIIQLFEAHHSYILGAVILEHCKLDLLDDTLLLVLCLDGGWRLSYRHEV